MKKTVAIYCDSLAMPGKTFEKEHYWEAYSDLLLMLKARGVNAYFVSDNETYLSRGVFTEGYTLEQKGSIEDLIRVPFIRADIVYNRGNFTSTDIPVFNPRQVYALGTDKFVMYDQLKEFQPYSVVCHTQMQLDKALEDIKTDLVVVKKPVSYGGRDVYIGTREEVLSKLPTYGYPYLAQEFMDTSIGIPGVVKGTHDLRIEMGGGEIWACYVRTPKAGEYRANVAQGGTATYLKRDQVPQDVAKLAKRIDARFGNQPRFYALDFANTPDGWKLIELNSQPGLCPLTYNEETAYSLTKLADYVGSITRKVRTPLHRLALTWSVAAARTAYEFEDALNIPVQVRRLVDDHVVVSFKYPDGVRNFLGIMQSKKYLQDLMPLPKHAKFKLQ